MNGITISLIFLITISMVLPASAIMYASGARTTPTDDNSGGSSDSDSTDDNNDASDSESTEDNSDSPPSSDFSTDNVDSSADRGSTDDNADLSTTPTENNPSLSSESTLSNNTGNTADIVNTILGIHNRDRADVGVPPLTWSDSLAASAQTWAEHMATIDQMVHSDDFSYGENIAGQSHGNSPGNLDTLIKMVESWAVEKENWHGGVLTEENAPLVGHYTQMVWKDTKQVGCGVASASVNDYLVCHYSPVGNSVGKAPY
jgi:uncharacterized protein YkwD